MQTFFESGSLKIILLHIVSSYDLFSVVNQKLEPQKSEPKETEKEKEVGKEKKREIDKETKKAVEKEKRKKEEDEVKKEKETKTKLGLDPEKSIRGSKSLSDLEPKAGRLRKSKVEVCFTTMEIISPNSR